MRNLIQPLFHLRGKTVVQQIAETALQAFSNDVAHFLGIQTTIFETYVAPILNSRNNRRIGRGPANTPLLKLPNQTGLAVASRRLSKMLFGIKLGHNQTIANGQRRQHRVIALAGCGCLNARETIKLNNATLRSQSAVGSGDHQSC